MQSRLAAVAAVKFNRGLLPDVGRKFPTWRWRTADPAERIIEHKGHKASPLPEKPVTIMTDESVSVVPRWRPELMLTAEETLRLGVEIFKRNAMRGDPDSPHGKVLRQRRGEYW